MTSLDHAVVTGALHAAGLAAPGVKVDIEPMRGGVSSDICAIRAGGQTYCAKRALDRLRVEAQWHAPVERNRFEVCWYRVANDVAPGSAPRVLWHDEEHMFFVMDYLTPSRHELWKEKLRQGRAETTDAENVGRILARIHSAAARDARVAALFPPNRIFHDIRLEPYLLATADRHPDLRPRLEALARTTADTRLTMIHGDVSPKNILIGPDGPVFLDAECACIGDPAFDLAFCLNHFLLKCLWNESALDRYLESFDVMTDVYLRAVDWEPAADFESRASALLPGLFLARVDGKSPVEYITEDHQREAVRSCARSLLSAPAENLAGIARAWRDEMKP